MKKKFIFAIILIISLTLLFTGCNNENYSEETDSQKESVEEITSSHTEESVSDETESSAATTETETEKLTGETESGTADDESEKLTDETESGTVEDETESTTIRSVTVTGQKNPIEIKSEELVGFNYTELFTITVNGESVAVEEEYIDSSSVKPESGTYTVSCTYEGQSAVAEIIVTKTEYKVELTQTEISIKESECEGYDFLSLFNATKDGVAVEITADMIDTDVKVEIGKYTFSVTLGDARATLTVNVIPNHMIEGIASYNDLQLTPSQIKTYDYTDLFSLYVDGVSVQITNDMLDISALENAEVGESYNVVLRYTLEKYTYTHTAKVTVVPETEVIVSAKNIVTYPNAKIIDLTELFTITRGDETIPVTYDMISGEVDYKKSGVYEITLNYEDKSAVATVEVKMGVVIQHATSDVIVIKQGTDMSTYGFDRDFVVIINGLRFTQIPASCIDKSQVDFSTPGTYEATITINYNDKKPTGLGSSITLTPYTKTISYKVVKSTYSVDVVNDELVLPIGTTSYNVFKNLSVVINNRKQTLTDNPEYVDSISCYAQVLSSSIDFASASAQKVEIAVYPEGPDSEPVIVEYTLRIDSDIVVTATGAAIFDGSKFYVKSLFSITEGGNPVEVTYDMISGKVDTFTPGVYYVSINYKGIVKTARVVVYGNSMVGTYHSGQSTIAQTVFDENDEEMTLPTDPIGDMVITSDGKISVRGNEATILEGIDENTIRIKIQRNEYMLYYHDGIVVLDPDNSIKLGFHEDKRPLLYFNTNKWNITDKLVVNSTSAHVLQNSITAYSFDVFSVETLDKSEKMWYALKINLVERTSADTVYIVSWGEAQFSEGFSKTAGEVATLIFDGDPYVFTMLNADTGKMNKKTDVEKQWANRVFTGTIDGVPATLETNQYEHYTLKINGETVFVFNSSLSSLKYGGIDYEQGIVYLYSSDDRDYKPYSYKFKINAENNTFEYVEKDSYFGKYVYENMYIFLDGYGNGLINFNSQSYYTTQLSYEYQNGEISVRYHNTTPTFSYGTGSTYYISPLLNVLTVKEFYDESIIGARFENQCVIDGAIVEILSYQIGSTDANKNMLLKQIRIITKDGELSESQKSSCVNTAAVKFNKGGFYQFTVTVKVGGEDVVSYYAVQILADTYAASPIVGYYGGGIINPGYNLTVNKYGQISLAIGIDYYEGMGEITDEGFYAYIYNANRNYIVLKGKLTATGVLEVSGSGQVNFNDIYTTGTVSIAGNNGTNGLYLRCIKSGDMMLFYMSSSEQSLGVAVTIKDENGAVLDSINNNTIVGIYKTADGDPIYIKLNTWGDVKNGISISDGYRGTYTCEGKPDMYLDGFGKATYDGNTYSYKNNDAVITVTVSAGGISLYRLNKSAGTYAELNFVEGNALLEGKSFTASHTFLCGYYSYSADTTFTFGKNGVVTIVSISEDHDNSCEEGDLYSPSFASKNGVSGKYSVSGDKVTVTAGGETFVFVIPNVLTASQIICESTTVESGEHGQFRVDTAFLLVE